MYVNEWNWWVCSASNERPVDTSNSFFRFYYEVRIVQFAKRICMKRNFCVNIFAICDNPFSAFFIREWPKSKVQSLKSRFFFIRSKYKIWTEWRLLFIKIILFTDSWRVTDKQSSIYIYTPQACIYIEMSKDKNSCGNCILNFYQSLVPLKYLIIRRVDFSRAFKREHFRTGTTRLNLAAFISQNRSKRF